MNVARPAGLTVATYAAALNNRDTDARITTDDLFEQGDRAAWRWRLQGAHRATGRNVSLTGIIIFRVRRGLIVEYWGHCDRLGMLEQQGLRA